MKKLSKQRYMMAMAAGLTGVVPRHHQRDEERPARPITVAATQRCPRVLLVWSRGNTMQALYLPAEEARPWHMSRVTTWVYDGGDCRLPGCSAAAGDPMSFEYTSSSCLESLTARYGNLTAAIYGPDGEFVSRTGSTTTFTYSNPPRGG